MPSVDTIYISPVKSLGLVQPATVLVEPFGIQEDRRFYLVDKRGALLTQREVGSLVQITANYVADTQQLTLRFPDGDTIEGLVDPGETVATRIWGRRVQGPVLRGPWSAALSEFCGREVNLVQPAAPGQSYDEYPISLVSQASLDTLSERPGAPVAFEGRRFRPNFLLTGCEPHQEDSWIGNLVQVGPDLQLRIIARDPRCAITTHDPRTGEPDADTLGLIISYRPSLRAAYFGVYGVVERPGVVSIGDQVVTL